MKQKNNGGFSLIEILVGMAILALIVLPTCTGMVMSFRLNAKTNQMLQAQLAVSSAVETLMAEGYSDSNAENVKNEIKESHQIELTITGTPQENYYEVTVQDSENMVSVTTHIRQMAGGNTE